MNKEDLFEAIGQVDEELLVDPQAIGHHAVSTAKKRKILAFAACFCLVIVGVSLFIGLSKNGTVSYSTEDLVDTTATTDTAQSQGVTANALATTDPAQSQEVTSAYELIDEYSTSEIEYIGTPFTQEEIDEICETYELYYTIDTDIALEDCYYSLTISQTKNIIDYNSLYYNVYSGDSLIYQVVFTKTDELGYELLAFDSVSYFTFVNMLENTQGQTVYSIIILDNYIRAYLSEDGSFYCTYDLSSLFDDENVDYVELFGCEENVFM